ncbi:hypothetical protein V6N13_115033 [Hibiscus sabdariffa]|uniref:Uncharacterized protein n=1 Tax=Hibiscus sabdariffa TaxID=183260 RepID=A0ABR2U3Z1_9ROSI
MGMGKIILEHSHAQYLLHMILDQSPIRISEQYLMKQKESKMMRKLNCVFAQSLASRNVLGYQPKKPYSKSHCQPSSMLPNSSGAPLPSHTRDASTSAFARAIDVVWARDDLVVFSQKDQKGATL